jgi:hypothetical protein
VWIIIKTVCVISLLVITLFCNPPFVLHLSHLVEHFDTDIVLFGGEFCVLSACFGLRNSVFTL